ncbi:hypothetical protein ACSVH2_10515 [Flavobacterium sp. RSB2_4_14]|uniref:hypothetical protein n=1 Tax=Flavobacterium sp. RSB2_4_14 TaxID=3447665 RepID=UPI003F30F9A2
MKKIKGLIGILMLVIVMVSCSSDNTSSEGTLRIKAKATYTNAANKNASDIVITSFKVNIRKIEFEVTEGMNNGSDDDANGDSDGDNNDGMYNGDDETELNGPWELDLLNQTAPVTTVTVPNGTYEEVEFKLSPSLVTTSPIYTKTFEIRGTINGTPFVFWHNFDEDFSIDYENAAQNLVIANGTYDLVFNFDLNQVLSQVDLSSAVDGDGDGVIEIGPDDTDGNNALATQLNDHIEDGCDMENENEDD